MKINMMIGKAMAAAVAATMLIGSTTVMADEQSYIDRLRQAAQEEMQRPNARRNDWAPWVAPRDLRPDANPTTPRVIVHEETEEDEIVHYTIMNDLDSTHVTPFGDINIPVEEETQAFTFNFLDAEDSSNPSETAAPDDDVPHIILEPCTDDDTRLPYVDLNPLFNIPESVSEPETDPAVIVIETVGNYDVTEENDDLPYHTGDIIRIGNEPTVISSGSFKVYFPENDYNAIEFTNASFYTRNGKLILNLGGISIRVGSYAGLGVYVDTDGTIALYPLTSEEVNRYDPNPQSDAEPEPPVIPVINDDPIMPEIPEVPEILEITAVPQTPVAAITPAPEAPAEQTTPAATVSTPATPAAPAAPAASTSQTTPAQAVPAAVSAPVTQVAGAVRLGSDDFVNHLYTTALGRTADSTGYAYWTGILSSGEMTQAEVAYAFLTSAEFEARDLNNVEFVTTLYSVFFNREPDHNGLNHWVSSIKNGEMTRAQVIDAFIGSPEWTNS